MQKLFVLISLLIVASAYESYMPNSKHPDDPDKCYLKETKDFIAPGAFVTPTGVCEKFTCQEEFVIRVDHCPRYMVPEMCQEIPADLTKAFPECCVKLRCTDAQGLEVIRPTV